MSDFYNNDSAAFDLEQYEEIYEQAEEAEGSQSENLPAGKYQVIVEKALLKASQNNNPMLCWLLRVLGPRHTGSTVWHRNMLVTKKNFEWLKRDLKIVGVQMQKLSDLNHRLNELLDVKLEISLRYNGDNQNIYFQKLLKDSGKSNHNDAATDGTDFDDIPLY